MENELKVTGKQMFMGIEIPVIEGGFGENENAVLAKDVSEIHGVELKKINELINNNLDEFEIGIDFLDLCDEEFKVVSKDLGFITSNGQKYCYILSEQGYIALTSIMKTKKAKEIRKKFRREYFNMRKTIKEVINTEDVALLRICKSQSPEETAMAVQEYRKVVTQPLVETIEKQKPFADLAAKRISEMGCYSITDVTRTLELKRGQITKFARAKGYIHKTIQEVNEAGLKYFKVYSKDAIHNSVGITDEGIDMLKDNLTEIMSY